ncbi:hypothetical protein LCGC14_2298820 [marine sediment metagenome]|uniref:Nudix hydrolase domain-containing protein n=1 Tax=marine sediment metagenome TaxID=412755 RepID=A0A0F9F1I3_9ZZZZ
MTFIPEERYNEIVQLLPICCVDIVISHDDKVLMIKREKSETYGGSWWIPGGRIHKGESWHTAVKRKVFNETGLSVNILRKVQSYEAPKVEDKHFITTLFVVSVMGDAKVELDRTSSDYKWVSSMDDSWDSLLQQMLRDAEVFDV